MITEMQLRIFSAMAKKPFAEHTRTTIKKELNEKSNNAIALTIESLKKEDVITEQKIGRSGIIKLNMDNDATYNYISLNNKEQISAITTKATHRIITAIEEETPFMSMIVFGSYANRKQGPQSDLDIAIFIDDNTDKKRIEALANSVKQKTPIECDINVIPRKEMIQMLTNKEENLGKQIARKHIAIHNLPIFYCIIKEAMRHGFRI